PPLRRRQTGRLTCGEHGGVPGGQHDIVVTADDVQLPSGDQSALTLVPQHLVPRVPVGNDLGAEGVIGVERRDHARGNVTRVARGWRDGLGRLALSRPAPRPTGWPGWLASRPARSRSPAW